MWWQAEIKAAAKVGAAVSRADGTRGKSPDRCERGAVLLSERCGKTKREAFISVDCDR